MSTSFFPASHEQPQLDLAREADVERCGALKEFWYPACLSEELGRRKPLGRTVFGLPLALFRDGDGQARAVRDRCLHRATALSAGVVVDGRLCCPYHGWSYDGAGRCVHIPSLGPLPDTADGTPEHVLSASEHKRSGLALAPEEVGCLRTFRTREQHGLVYVYLGEQNAPRQEPFAIPHWGEPGWVVYFMVTPFQNGVTNLIENFMDVPHTVYVHRGWFRRQKQKRVPARVERRSGAVLVTYHQEKDELSGLGRIMNPLGLIGRGHPMVHTDKYYIPNITRVDYTWSDRSGFIITSQCTPRGPTDSLVYTAISYRLPIDLPKSPIARGIASVMRWYTTQVIRQDTDIMDAQRRGMTAGGEPVTFASTEADLLHKDIERYRAWLLDGGQGDGPPDAARDIVFFI